MPGDHKYKNVVSFGTTSIFNTSPIWQILLKFRNGKTRLSDIKQGKLVVLNHRPLVLETDSHIGRQIASIDMSIDKYRIKYPSSAQLFSWPWPCMSRKRPCPSISDLNWSISRWNSSHACSGIGSPNVASGLSLFASSLIRCKLFITTYGYSPRSRKNTSVRRSNLFELTKGFCLRLKPVVNLSSNEN